MREIPERACGWKLIAAGLAVFWLPCAVGLANQPELPRVFLDTTYFPLQGNTIHVPSGGNLQAAIDQASYGDTISLQAGGTFTGNFILRKEVGSGWIYIRTSTPDAQLPAPGSRIHPSDAPLLARIVSPNSSPAFSTVAAAHNYRLIGLEVTVDPAVSISYNLIGLGDGSGSQNSLAQVPFDLIVDRCYIHGNPTQADKRGVEFNSIRTAVIDSYISEIHNIGQDTQAIGGWNGPGPFKIVNNYLEAAGENVMFGGALASIPNLVPSDIEIRHNYFFKPLSWMVGDPSYAGYHWTIKNLFELKNAQRALIDGNILEHCWLDAQNGYAVDFTPRTQNGQMPWAVVADITFTHNIVRHVGRGFDILGSDAIGGQLSRVLIADSLLDDVSANWNSDGTGFVFLKDSIDLQIDHITGFTEHEFAAADVLPPEVRFVFNNSIFQPTQYGFFGSGKGTGIPALQYYFPGYVFRRNALVGENPSVYPPGNFFPHSLDDVGFVNRFGGDYHLGSNSPYKNAGTDGKDVGADIDAINIATAGVVSGSASRVPVPTALYPLTPCRVIDTRIGSGPLGGPALAPNATRNFDVAGVCGILAAAVSISANLTITNSGAQGELVLFPSDVSRPDTSAISFRAFKTRANNALVYLSATTTTFSVFNNSAATVDFILDVNGYFQ